MSEIPATGQAETTNIKVETPVARDHTYIKEFILGESLAKPVVFEGFINHWTARQWSPEYFAKHETLSRHEILYRVSGTSSETKRGHQEVPVSGIQRENESKYISCAFEEFVKYVADSSLSSAHEWVYADYKYMQEIFEVAPQLLKDIDWGDFGFHGRDGSSSTFWMGSRGAFTSCHYDTYGSNLVAQLFGRKKWTLFPPSELDKLYPVRVPFEESTVFSQVDIRSPDFHKFPRFADALRYEITLEPGQVLYVPKHWWHFVECQTTSITVNTWIELESDRKDNVTEVVAAMLTKGLADYAGTSAQNVYNPKEVPLVYEEGIALLNNLLTPPLTPKEAPHRQLATLPHQCNCCSGSVNPLKPLPPNISSTKREQRPANTNSLNISDLLQCITHPRVLDSILNELIAHDTRVNGGGGSMR